MWASAGRPEQGHSSPDNESIVEQVDGRDLEQSPELRLFERASKCVESGNFQLAIPLLNRVVNGDSDHAEAWHKLGFAFGELGRRDLAIQCFDKAILLRPDWGEAWNNRGWYAFKKHDYRVAIENFERALEINPNSGGCWSNLGLALTRTNQMDEATRAFEMATRSDPQCEVHWFNHAKLQAKTGNRKGAVNGFKRACELRPTYVKAWIRLAFIVRDRSEWPRTSQRIASEAGNPGVVVFEPPNFGRVLERENYSVTEKPPASKEKWAKSMTVIQNPVAWILVLVLASLLYILLGK